MLILTRRPGESVKIGDDITITVLSVKGNQLRLGFTAPKNIGVHREEIYQRIQAEKITSISQARTYSRSSSLHERGPKSSFKSDVDCPRSSSLSTGSEETTRVSRSGTELRQPRLRLSAAMRVNLRTKSSPCVLHARCQK